MKYGVKQEKQWFKEVSPLCWTMNIPSLPLLFHKERDNFCWKNRNWRIWGRLEKIGVNLLFDGVSLFRSGSMSSGRTRNCTKHIDIKGLWGGLRRVKKVLLQATVLPPKNSQLDSCIWQLIPEPRNWWIYTVQWNRVGCGWLPQSCLSWYFHLWFLFNIVQSLWNYFVSLPINKSTMVSQLGCDGRSIKNSTKNK